MGSYTGKLINVTSKQVVCVKIVDCMIFFFVVCREVYFKSSVFKHQTTAPGGLIDSEIQVYPGQIRSPSKVHVYIC